MVKIRAASPGVLAALDIAHAAPHSIIRLHDFGLLMHGRGYNAADVRVVIASLGRRGYAFVEGNSLIFTELGLQRAEAPASLQPPKKASRPKRHRMPAGLF